MARDVPPPAPVAPPIAPPITPLHSFLIDVLRDRCEEDSVPGAGADGAGVGAEVCLSGNSTGHMFAGATGERHTGKGTRT